MSEIAQELERIARSAPDGVLTPSAVVESARDEGSPLHDKFEWDDGVAAEAWRRYLDGAAPEDPWRTRAEAHLRALGEARR